MKKILVMFSVLLMLFTIQSYSQDSLVANIPCDNSSLMDWSGHANSITLVSSYISATENRFGESGCAMKYNTTSTIGEMEIGTNDVDSVFTLSMWIKPSTTSSDRAELISKSASSYIRIATNYIMIGPYENISVSNTDWHHYVLIMDNAGFKLYYDGIFIFTSNIMTHNQGNPIYIFKNFQYGNEDCHAWYDDIKMFNVALEQNQIDELFTENLTTNTEVVETPINKIYNNTLYCTNNSEISVYNSSGQLISQHETNEMILDLRKGFYIIRIKNSETDEVIKHIVR